MLRTHVQLAQLYCVVNTIITTRASHQGSTGTGSTSAVVIRQQSKEALAALEIPMYRIDIVAGLWQTLARQGALKVSGHIDHASGQAAALCHCAVGLEEAQEAHKQGL